MDFNALAKSVWTEAFNDYSRRIDCKSWHKAVMVIKKGLEEAVVRDHREELQQHKQRVEKECQVRVERAQAQLARERLLFVEAAQDRKARDAKDLIIRLFVEVFGPNKPISNEGSQPTFPIDQLQKADFEGAAHGSDRS